MQLQGCTIALASFLEEHNLRASPLDGEYYSSNQALLQGLQSLRGGKLH